MERIYVVIEKGDEGNAESGPKAWDWEYDALAAFATDMEYGPTETNHDPRIFHDAAAAAQRALDLAEEHVVQYVVAEIKVKLTGMYAVPEYDEDHPDGGTIHISRKLSEALGDMPLPLSVQTVPVVK